MAFVIVAAAVLILLTAFWFWWRAGDASRETLLLSGNIELTQVDLGFKIPGKLVQLNLEEGDLVELGALVARLDDTQLRQQRAQAAAGLEAMRSRALELQAQIVFQEENSQAQIEQRAAELSQAEAGLAELLSGSRTQEVEQARAAVDRAESLLEQARSDWDRAQRLRLEIDISRAQYEQFQTVFETAQAGLLEATQRLALLVEGPRAEDIDAARAQVERARAGLRQARALLLDVNRLRQALTTSQAEISRGEAELAQLESQLEDTVLLAPLSGVVMVKSAETGEVLPAGSSVATLADLSRPWMRAYIPARALGRVRLGQPAVVRTDSYPGKAYPGTVTFISPEAEFTPKQIQTPEQRSKLVYRIKIRLDNPNQELKLNMPCDAEIGLAPEQAATYPEDP